MQSYLLHKYGVFIDETELLITRLSSNAQKKEEQISVAYANIALAQYGNYNILIHQCYWNTHLYNNTSMVLIHSLIKFNTIQWYFNFIDSILFRTWIISQGTEIEWSCFGSELLQLACCASEGKEFTVTWKVKRGQRRVVVVLGSADAVAK